jgi:AAA domain/CHC2 zinc finger
MPFDDKYLDDLRAAVPVSTVVGRNPKHKLKRVGAGEYKLVDDPSFTVSDKKGFFYDFGSHAEGGDVFQYLVAHCGYTFPQAVEEVAKIAGLAEPKPNGAGRRSRSNGSAAAADHEDTGTERAADAPDRKRTIIATYNYENAQGEVIYRVIRTNPKGFYQERANGRGGFSKGLGNVEHTIYHLPEVLNDMKELREDQSRWFLCEGERDVDTVVAWGMFATTNSGGAQNFTRAMARHFTDAADVVLLEDDDDAGRRRMLTLVPMLQEYGARVRVLKIADHDERRPKDITDWCDVCGGDKDKLYAISDALPEWSPPAPEPFKSTLGVKTYADLAGHATPYEWRVKGLVPKDDHMLIMGSSRSGKTFATLDLAMHVVLGRRYNGRKVIQGGIAYCVYEGQKGFENRLRGYIKAHGLAPEDLRNFAWWTQPPGLYADKTAPELLAREIVEVSKAWSHPIAAVVVDTHNSATRGSSEIKSDEIGRVLDAYDQVGKLVSAPLWIVSHTNSEGKHRGNEQIFNRIETALYVEKVVDGKGVNAVERKDSFDRTIRKIYVEKQREGDDKHGWEFTLSDVIIGVDMDGDPIKTNVVTELTRDPGEMPADVTKVRAPLAPGTWHLNGGEVPFFHALLKAIGEWGTPPPGELELPRSVALVVTWQQIVEKYKAAIPVDDNTAEGRKKWVGRIKTAMHRARRDLAQHGVIGVAQHGKETPDRAPVHLLWPTGRPVVGKGIRWPSNAFVVEKAEPEVVDQTTGKDVMEDFKP